MEPKPCCKTKTCVTGKLLPCIDVEHVPDQADCRSRVELDGFLNFRFQPELVFGMFGRNVSNASVRGAGERSSNFAFTAAAAVVVNDGGTHGHIHSNTSDAYHINLRRRHL